MQSFLVFLAIAAAVIFLGRRVWKSLKDPKITGCGCTQDTRPQKEIPDLRPNDLSSEDDAGGH